jgi:ribosome-binding protein aMBF1 (putative translation factor)
VAKKKKQRRKMQSDGGVATLEPSQKGPKVGRKRQPQSKEVAKSLTGKFGANLAALAEQANLDADTLGDKIGRSGDMVRLYFAGRSVPPLNDWPKIAKALGVTLRELLPE